MTGNLLTEAILPILGRDGRERLTTLPGLFQALERNEVLSFPGLRAHQAHPWHAFLCQLTALALEGEELPPPPKPPDASFLGLRDENEWRERLRALTPDFPDDEPWTLTAPDLSKPGFLQPPVPEGAWSALNLKAESPDDLDVLITSKNFGVKCGKLLEATAAHWVYALVSVQTHGNYSKGNFSIARQNGSYGTRPGVSCVTDPFPGGQWARDTRVILDLLAEGEPSGPGFDPNGLGLLWLEPWDGARQLSIETLHPLFIEICRRIRLRVDERGLFTACRASTKGPRLAAKDIKGNLGDPWIPINRSTGAAFNAKPGYKNAVSILFDSEAFQPAPLQLPRPLDRDRPIAVRFRVLSRGQGTSEGFHERLVSVPRKHIPLLGESPKDAADLSKRMISLAGDAGFKVLRASLTLLLQAEKSFPDFKDKDATSYASTAQERFEREIDDRFFPCFWECLDLLAESQSMEEALQPWLRLLRGMIRRHFERALHALPVSTSQRFKAVAKAERYLLRMMREHLPLLERAEPVSCKEVLSHE